MNKIYTIRQMIVSSMAFIFLSWACFHNELWTKIVMLPFLTCSLALFFENAFIILGKIHLSNIFKYIFRISLFIYAFGFIFYMIYYSIANKSYSILIPAAVFSIFILHFLKKAFSKKKDK